MQRILDRFPGGRATGTFLVEPGKTVFGDLKLQGIQTSLDLHHDKPLVIDDRPGFHICGNLHAFDKVTLLDCLLTRQGSMTATVEPQFVVFGSSHVVPEEAPVQSLGFVIDDAAALFHGCDAFGTVMDAEPHITSIVKTTKPDREVVTGSFPLIHYFTGKTEIFRVETCLGTVAAHHNPSWRRAGAAGIRMDNTIFVTLTFRASAALLGAVAHVFPLIRFLEILIGRPQNLEVLWVRLPDIENGPPNLLDVYWTHPPERQTTFERRQPHPSDILLSPVARAPEFARVMTQWLACDADRRHARVRFHQAFGLQRNYPIDRIVSAANMFDLLPHEAAPPVVELTREVRDARDQSRALFKALPPSLERNAMLRALGRIGKSNLKHKIRHRAQPIIAAMGNLLRDLDIVIDEAVNCRNYYVHGTPCAITHDDHLAMAVFLNDTLEFVFTVSELIEAGWDIADWCRRGSGLSHPFAAYRNHYEANLQTLREILNAA